MQKEKVGYKVFVWGESMQIIEVVLDPGKTIPAGAIFNNWIEGGITSKTQADHHAGLDQGVFGRLLDSGKKRLGRTHHPVTYFTNPGNVRKCIAFAAPLERQILPVHLTEKDGNFFCHKEAFICTDSGIEIISESSSPLKSNFLGLEKSDWLKFRGNGIIFVHVGGSFKNKQLKKKIVLSGRSIKLTDKNS